MPTGSPPEDLSERNVTRNDLSRDIGRSMGGLCEAGRLPTAATINPPRPDAYELPSEAYGMGEKNGRSVANSEKHDEYDDM